MGLSKIDICNHALLKVGADTIASLDTAQATTDAVIYSAKLCNIFFDYVLDEALRLYPWNNATKSASLFKLTEKPNFEWDSQFELPADFIRLINLYDSTDAIDDRTEWCKEGNKVLCNYDQVFITYVAKPEDVSILDALATQCIICILAMKLVQPMQLDDSLHTKIQQELVGFVLPQARSIDTFENKHYDVEASDWLYSRNYNSPIY